MANHSETAAIAAKKNVVVLLTVLGSNLPAKKEPAPLRAVIFTDQTAAHQRILPKAGSIVVVSAKTRQAEEVLGMRSLENEVPVRAADLVSVITDETAMLVSKVHFI